MKLKQNIPFQNWIKDQSVRINSLSENVKPESFHMGAHIHHYHEILYLQGGKGEMLIDDKRCTLSDQTIYCIWQGQVHEWIEGRQRQGYAIMFKTDFLPAVDANTLMVFNSTLFNRVQKINAFPLARNEICHFDSLFEHMLAEYDQSVPTFGQKQTMQYLLMSLLVKLARKTVEMDRHVQARTKTSLDIFQAFLTLIEQYYQSDVGLDFYANQLGTSSRKLNEIIKDHAGQTAKQLLMKRTLTEAKRLLFHTSTPVKEIAYRLGFKNQAYFSHFFKRQVGQSPQSYRNRETSS